jgi:hypothetical protein
MAVQDVDPAELFQSSVDQPFELSVVADVG